ncbi:hypothetical protein TTHERM_00137770 (macronuclear) [Tetrahymena thermophila SB210]|uniref:Transmembrane protein n=1 Tax=Tetrahymena thermophila (strain SB210) TaxID=312017 RepID=I7M283_TETTS|nr:hypothetical protein TTHERM_00137770 [Tetrahymena thermophila SB210]EAR99514.1 hypothetical protein TTHERM_00137770 [Tetrahymena thermophila SB210]|eukprot:XP_001019759.1 hypothetical protein TTHERM_00137770 [Tetrahymena thermophila SB210]
MRLLASSILFILAIANVSALSSKDAQQCQTSAKNSVQTLCLPADIDCALALKSVANCLKLCTQGPSQSDSYILNCAKTNCTTSNLSVQSWVSKFISCLHLGKLSLSFLLLALFAIVF